MEFSQDRINILTDYILRTYIKEVAHEEWDKIFYHLWFEHNMDFVESETLFDIKHSFLFLFKYFMLLDKYNILNQFNEIQDYMFSGGRLAEIVIPDTIVSIHHHAFNSVTPLMHVTIPTSIKYIGAEAFKNSVFLNALDYTGTKEQWDNIAKSPFWKSRSEIQVIHCSDGDIKV